MKARDKIVHKSITWYSVAATAKMLGVTKMQAREMMGKGELEWTQLEPNGPLFVAAHSIIGHRKWKGK